ncbi:MAG: beta-lactamase family protein [Anaerolineaceae bacterium]|nr:beta-lactamase family protein [Anaerolineaceae bacterium]
MMASTQPSPADGEALIIQEYRELIPQLMAEQDIPGLAVAVVDDSRVLWVEGFGYTNDDHKTAITPDTIFSVQSTSKTFTAVAIMTAVQDGLLNLDTPITTYLPDFTVHSIFEEHPERKITLRMLLGHTAGFTHEAPVGNNFDLEPVTFEAHIQSISDTWLRFPVGTGYAYSNLGIDLAGYILQTVSGQPFAQYVEEKLLLPIGMANSSFDMTQIRANPNRAIGHSSPLPEVPLEVPMVPAGGLYTSANDMARFIQFHLNQGSAAGQTVLSPALLDEMYTVPPPVEGSPEGYALGVARTQWHRGREAVIFSHGGGGFGFLSDMWWLPELKIGIVVLTNATDHNLQGELALNILYDFVHDPTSVYYERLMALPRRTVVRDGDGRYRPPIGLAQAIAEQALPPSDQDQLRWAKYIGDYSTAVWGVLDPTKALGQVYQQGSHLFIEVKVGGTANKLRLTEVEPGLFFTGDGEALDFRGDVPTLGNIKITRIGAGPSLWQQAILAVCALVFLTMLLFPPLRSIIHRFRGVAPAGTTVSRGRWLASTAAISSSLFGLLSIGLVIAMPMIIYSGFLGWLELPLWQRLLMHAPLAFLVTGAGFLALNGLAWKNGWWSPGERIGFVVFDLAFIAVLLFFSYWRLIGLSLG